MNPDNTPTFFRAARHFFSGTLLSRLSGLARDVATAAFFGVDKEIAALMLAYRLVHLPRRVFGEGAMQVAFIPQFEKQRYEDPAAGFRFFIDLKWGLAATLCLFLGILILGFQGALQLQLSGDLREIINLSRHILPSLLFICLYGMNASLLQCEKQFFLPSVTPVFFNLSWIAGAYFFKGLPKETAMIAMTWMINLGCFLQWAATVPAVYNHVAKYHALHIPRLRLSAFKLLLGPLSLAIAGVIAQQLNSAVDPLFARAADASGPALLWYAVRLYQLPLALFGIAIASALLPSLSRACEREDHTSAAKLLALALKQNFFLMIPLTAAMFLFGRGAIELVFQRGSFSSQDALATAACFWGYTPGLLPATLILILAPTFYARHDYRTPFRGALLSVTCNLGLNAAAIYLLRMGPESVAWATSLSAWVNLAWLLACLDQESAATLKKTVNSPFMARLLLFTAAASASGALAGGYGFIAGAGGFLATAFALLAWNRPFLKQLTA